MNGPENPNLNLELIVVTDPSVSRVVPTESRAAFRRAVDLSFDAQDHARRVAVIQEMAEAGVLYQKPIGRRKGSWRGR